jgi:hypothetical protein
MILFKTTPFSCMALALGAALSSHAECFSSDRPNILRVILEDTNDWMGCYGDNLVATPHIDALAGSGTRFDPAYAYELARHRLFLAEWMVTTHDKGQYPESLRELRGIVRKVGDQAVNPEYDPVR